MKTGSEGVEPRLVRPERSPRRALRVHGARLKWAGLVAATRFELAT